MANTTSSFGNTATTDTSYTTKASLTAIGMNYTTPANAYNLYNITARVKYSASTMNLECILVNYTTSAIVATTSNVSVTTTKGWFTASFASPPVVNASSVYVLMVVSAGTSLYSYYSSTTTGYQYAGSLSSWAATSVTSLTHTNATNYEIYANCSIGIPNYQLGLEENFTSVESTYNNYNLSVFMGTWTTTDTIGLQAWGGSSWTTLSSSLTNNSWNNFTSVSSYILSGTMTIKFIQVTQANATVQDTWMKCSCLLYIWGYENSASVTTLTNTLTTAPSRVYAGSRSNTALLNSLGTVPSRVFGTQRSSTSLLNSLSTFPSRIMGKTASITTTLQNLGTSVSRVYAGSRTNSILLNSLSLTPTRSLGLKRSSNALLNSLALTASQSKGLQRTATALLSNLATSASRTFGKAVSLSTLLQSFASSAARTLSTYRSNTALLNTPLTGASRTIALYRTSTTLLNNILTAPNRAVNLFRSIWQWITGLFTPSATSSSTPTPTPNPSATPEPSATPAPTPPFYPNLPTSPTPNPNTTTITIPKNLGWIIDVILGAFLIGLVWYAMAKPISNKRKR